MLKRAELYGLILALLPVACGDDGGGGGTGTDAGTDTSSTTSVQTTSSSSTSSTTTGTGTSSTSSTATTSTTSTVTTEPDSSSSSDSGSSSTGEPGPTSGFCECSNANPADNAGSFEMCSELLVDGTGTYYEPPPYVRTSDADSINGNPAGVVTAAQFSGSTVYPDTTWNYWVYVPAQYDGSEPAALFILTDGEVYQNNGDGAAYRTPTVLDNLIAEGVMPTTIALFVSPGENGGGSARSLEYNTPDDAYVTFLLDELVPEALGTYSITDEPSLRAIGGRSSGGAAAFTAGWERPDAFGLIYTTLGSFVQLRANADGEFADIYPDEILSEPRKPLRVTLLSGTQDLDNEFGNWRDAHMAMTTSLDCAGYTYRSGFGETQHGDSSHPHDEFGNDLRWLFAG